MPATGSEAQNTTGVVYLQDPSGQDLSNKLPEGLQDIIAVAAADDSNLALRKDGTVFEWSTASDLKVVLTGASSIDARGHRRLAVMTDGSATAWNSSGTFVRVFEGIKIVRGAVLGPFPYTSPGKTEAPFFGVTEDGKLYMASTSADFRLSGWNQVIGASNVVRFGGGFGAYLLVLSEGQVQQRNGVLATSLDPWSKATGGMAVSGAFNTGSGNRLVVGFDNGDVLQRWPLSPPIEISYPSIRPASRIRQLCSGAFQDRVLYEDGSVALIVNNTMKLSTSAPTNAVAIAQGGLGVLFVASRPAVPPTIHFQTQIRQMRPGNLVSFEARAAGVTPITYRWTRNGTTDIGINSPVLTFENAGTNVLGDYQMTACNTWGCVTSEVIRVMLAPVGPQEVTSYEDAGPGTLREALHNANASGNSVISLTNLTGIVRLIDPLPCIRSSTTLFGPGPDKLTLTGTNLPTPLCIATQGNCTIFGLRFSSFQSGRLDLGGAILNLGSLRVADCLFESNVSSNAGGAIFSSGQLQVQNSTFRSNSVLFAGTSAGLLEGGGAVAVYQGQVWITNCTFVGNKVRVKAISGFGSGAYGGAISISGSTGSMSGCLIVQNKAEAAPNDSSNLGGQAGGAGIYCTRSSFELSSCLIASNQAIASIFHGSAIGGGIYAGNVWGNKGGRLQLNDCTILTNFIVGGYGSYTINGGVQQASAYPSRGAGIASWGCTLSLTNSTVAGNRAESGITSTDFGQGIRCSGYMGAAAQGAGIYVNISEASLSSCTVVGNVAWGGFVDGRPPCVPAYIVDIQGTGTGGGVANDGGIIRVVNTLIAANVSGPRVSSPDVDGKFASEGFNLIENTNASLGWIERDVWGLSPGLGSIEPDGHGGSVYTLLPDSLAIGSGSDTTFPATDQRGFPRGTRGATDIGAYESPSTRSQRPPRILDYDTNIVVPAGTRLTLRTWVVGTQPLHWEWIKDGVPLTSTAGAHWSTDRATLRQAGIYRFRVSNDAGTVESGVIHVGVEPPPQEHVWTAHPMGLGMTSALNKITFASDQFVAVGESPGVVMTSKDGADWTERFRSKHSSMSLRGLAYYSGKFIAAGPGGIITSTNSIDWEVRSSIFTNELAVIVGGAPGFLLAGTQGNQSTVLTVWTSANGNDWAPEPRSQLIFRDVTALAAAQVSLFYCQRGWIYSSTNLIEWQFQPSRVSEEMGATIGTFGTDTGFLQISYSQDFQRILLSASENSLSWHRLGSFTNSGRPITATAYGAGQYLLASRAIGDFTLTPDGYGTPTVSLIHGSNDGEHWQTVYSADVGLGGLGLVDAAYGNGRFVFLDRSRGLAIRSADPAHPDLSLRTEGTGVIRTDPEPSFLQYGQSMTLTAIPGRWHRFDHWADWITNATRTDLVSSVNDFTAFFAPTTRLETITVGNVSRTAPVGMPSILANGLLVTSGVVSNQREVHVSLSTTLTNATLRWTFDGSVPRKDLRVPPRELLLRHSGRLRVIAYPNEGGPAIESDPVDVVIDPAYTLSVATQGGGTVSTNPMLALYPPHSKVTVQAMPAPGWVFWGWEGDSHETISPLEFIMEHDVTIEAVFAIPFASVALQGGAVIADPELQLYPYGSRISLTAVPSATYAFAGWTDFPTNTPSQIPWTIQTASPRPTARFVRLKTGEQSLITRTIGRGSISQSSLGSIFKKGQTVTLNAVALSGEEFVQWKGDASGQDPHLTVVMDRNKDITAQFTRRPNLKIASRQKEGPMDGVGLILEGYPGTAYEIEVNAGDSWSSFQTVTQGIRPMVLHVSVTKGTGLRFYRARELRP